MSEMNTSYEERMRILEMIEQGVITAVQGSELIRALEIQEEDEGLENEMILDEVSAQPKPDSTSYPSPPPAEPAPEPGRYAETPRAERPRSSQPNPGFARWRNWWYLPLSFGILVTVFSGWMLYLGTQNEWAGFWMACIWLPLLFGIMVMVLSWLSHSSLWVHVRVNTGQDEWPRRIAISLPLPLRFGAWAMRTFQDRIPGIPNMENVPLDEIITAVRKGVKPEAPIYIEVDNGPGQEQVEVYIG
jgi:hypothetical protein